MASVLALRALLGAGLGLGALDLVWINAGLAPRLNQPEPAAAPVTATVTPPPVPAAATPPGSAPAVPARDEPADAPPVAPEPSPRASQDADKPERVETMRVYFATGSAKLDARTRELLAQLAEAAGPSTTIVLEGHADYRGDERFNEWLSKDRALAVERQLVRLGIDRARISVGFAGEGNATGELWRDRRVDIQITGGTR